MPVMFRVWLWLRRSKAQVASTVLVIGFLSGVAMGTVAGTRRTESAPDRYTADAGGDPGLRIYQEYGPPLTDQIASLPGVESAKSQTFMMSFLTLPADGGPYLETESYAGDADAFGVRLVEGRLADPDSTDEVVVNRPMAELLAELFDRGVGDTFEFVSFTQAQLETNLDNGEAEPGVAPFTATLVGVTDDLIDFDDPFPHAVFAAPIVAAHPDVATVTTETVIRLAADADASAVLDSLRQLPGGSELVVLPPRLVSSDSRRAVNFHVAALWMVSAATVVAAAVVVALIAGRALRITDDERVSLPAIGWTKRNFVHERAAEGAVIAVLALPVAAVTGAALTSLFPLGDFASFEPDPGTRMDWTVAALGALVLLAILVAVGAMLGAQRPRRTAGRRPSALGALLPNRAGMPSMVGLRFATTSIGGRSSMGGLIVGGIAFAGIVGATVTGLSLVRLVDEPARWGVNYDALYGNPYIDAPFDIVSTLAEHPDVDDATGIHFGLVSIDGNGLEVMAFDPAKGHLVPTTLDGRPPATDGEIGLGAEVARRLHVGIGDAVAMTGDAGTSLDLEVVGIVVLPDTAGDGVAVTFEALQQVSPDVTQHVAFVTFRDGTPPSTLTMLDEEFFTETFTKPQSVGALERVADAPVLLACVLAILLLAGSAFLLIGSVQARRHDLAVLCALGANRRQLRAVVHWQATAIAVVTIAVGLPLGVALGRLAVGLLTRAIGIVPGTDAPVLIVGAIVAAPVLFANAIAVIPARSAAKAQIGRLSADH